MLVWMLKGPQAGKFVPVTTEQGEELIAAGDAQSALTQATLIKTPEYATREMRATTDTPKKARRKRKPKEKAATDAAA